jgi:amino acid adenylation domain-containing protein
MSTLLQELVTTQADRWPDMPAVVWRRMTLTYADLEARSNQLARALRDVGCRRGDRVCVSSLPSPEAIVAVLAVYKADAIYVPLDVESPPARLAKAIQASEPKCVLTCAATAQVVDRVVRLGALAETVPVGALTASPIIGERFTTTFCLADVRHLPTRSVPYRNRASNAAQIVFSGGPASAPVGVVLTHANIRRFVLWANEHFGVVPGDRHLLQDALSADVSTYAMIGALAAGASLYPVSTDVARTPARLLEFVREAGLTLWLSSTQTMSAMAQLDLILPGDLPSVRHVVWQQRDSPRPASIRHWLTRLRHVRFTALYGPVEATIASSYHTMLHRADGEGLPLPIGRSRTDVGVTVLDADLRPVAPGQIGEICITGAGLGPGYWRDPERTRTAFVRSQPAGDATTRTFRTGDLGLVGLDGLIHPAGTVETVVHTNGHRFEVGEIEAALAGLGSVQAAAVVTAGRDEAGAALCCAYVPVPGVEVRPADLCAELALLLPAHMLPTRWRALDRLPHDADGTVGREQIRDWFAGDGVSLG